MNVKVLERPETRDEVKLTTVDCDIHPSMASGAELAPFLAQRWRDHMKTYGPLLRGGLADSPVTHFRMAPDTARADAFPPNGGPPGSDLAFMREQHLDRNGIEYGILIPLRTGSASQRHTDFGAALSSAMNDWQVDKWLDNEPRLRGSIIVTHDEPDAAVAEIRKRASDRRFVQILVPPRTVEPFGRRRYWPLFEAACEHDLPLSLHVGGINGFPTTGAGWPSFYFEDHHNNVQVMQSLISSMVLEGVFERFPTLKIVLVEAGFAWVPALCWRLDRQWQRMREEVPEVKRPPSAYVREHFWFTTQPIDEPTTARHMLDVLDWVGTDRIMFSTDYPHWDFDDPRYTFKVPLNPREREMIFQTNAKALFGLA